MNEKEIRRRLEYLADCTLEVKKRIASQGCLFFKHTPHANGARLQHYAQLGSLPRWQGATANRGS